MINRSLLKFHDTFQPEPSYISKILDLAVNSYAGTKFEISDITGIPTGKQRGKVEPSIKYASYMGLVAYQVIKGKYTLSLTGLGKEVYLQDKYMHELATRWICHYELTSVHSGASQWAYIVNNVDIGFNNSISSNYMLKQAIDFYKLEVDFEELFGVVKRSYISGFFESLHYVDWEDRLEFNEHPAIHELLFVYAYALLKNWEILLGNKPEITSLELKEKLKFGRIFGFNDAEESEVLDMLAAESVITVNRQLFPTTIISLSSSADMVSRLYKNLL